MMKKLFAKNKVSKKKKSLLDDEGYRQLKKKFPELFLYILVAISTCISATLFHPISKLNTKVETKFL